MATGSWNLTQVSTFFRAKQPSASSDDESEAAFDESGRRDVALFFEQLGTPARSRHAGAGRRLWSRAETDLRATLESHGFEFVGSLRHPAEPPLLRFNRLRVRACKPARG